VPANDVSTVEIHALVETDSTVWTFEGRAGERTVLVAVDHGPARRLLDDLLSDGPITVRIEPWQIIGGN
jgi:hypothetical protein